MNRFEVGQKVVALTNPRDSWCQPRIKGNTYTVMAIKYCVKCGEQLINIGEMTDVLHGRCGCGNIYSINGLFWTYSKYFAPLEEKSDEEIRIEEKIKELLLEPLEIQLN